MISLLQILEQCDLTDYDICFVQIGENDVKTAKNDLFDLNNHDLMHALINIIEEFQRQGVRHVTCLSPYSLATIGFRPRLSTLPSGPCKC